MRRHLKTLRRLLGVFLALYVAAAVVPYAAVPRGPEEAAVSAIAARQAASGDRATILPTGRQALEARLNLIANAKTSLVVGTYLYADDESGRAIAAALLAAADRGVSVRVLTDGLIGAANLLGSNLGYALGTHPNIEVRYYNPVNLLEPWGLSARYHEKYVIADDRVFVLGGRNVSDEFLTQEGHPSYNYDMDVLVWRESPAEGSACAALGGYGDAVWGTQCERLLTCLPACRREAVEKLRGELNARYAALRQSYAGAMAPADWEAQTAPIDGFTLLYNPMEAGVKQPGVWAGLTALMREARERVWIQTPYLVLNSRMRDDLAQAAALPSDMQIITNSRAGGNNIVASADAVFHRPMVTKMELALYEFQGGASMHTKTMLIDRDISVFGSFNFDMRSAYSDTELMLVIRSEAVNEQLEAHMREMRAQSLRVEADGGYVQEDGVEALVTPWGKNLLILLASPLISLVRFLV